MRKKVLVSLFESYKLKNPVQLVDLFDWLCDDRFKQQAEMVRATELKSKQRELKALLPCITPSGIFSYCSDSSLDKHSGYVCIDIDAKDNSGIQDFELLKQRVSRMRHIAYCGLSISGNGIFCIIPIAYPHLHKEHFNALELYFQQEGIVIDGSCRNVSRLRGASYDPAPFLNVEGAAPFDLVIEHKQTKESGNTSMERRGNPALSPSCNGIPMIMGPALERIALNGIDITVNRSHWFKIGCSLANEFGEEGRYIFHAVSRFYRTPEYEYTEKETDMMYDGCLRSKYKGIYSIGTFYHYLKENGIL